MADNSGSSKPEYFSVHLCRRVCSKQVQREACTHTRPCFMFQHPQYNHVCHRVRLYWLFFVSYWLLGNEGPPPVINGHNYVIEEWSASSCKEDQMSRQPAAPETVLLPHGGVSTRPRPSLCACSHQGPLFFLL